MYSILHTYIFTVLVLNAVLKVDLFLVILRSNARKKFSPVTCSFINKLS